MWKVDYDNDTGPDDGGYSEWWIVTNGDKYFTSRSESDAIWLCGLLNERDRDA
jgi:hypothetical protein